MESYCLLQMQWFQTSHFKDIYSFQKIVTVTFENVCRLAGETSSCVLKCVGIQCLSPLFALYS